MFLKTKVFGVVMLLNTKVSEMLLKTKVSSVKISVGKTFMIFVEKVLSLFLRSDLFVAEIPSVFEILA